MVGRMSYLTKPQGVSASPGGASRSFPCFIWVKFQIRVCLPSGVVSERSDGSGCVLSGLNGELMASCSKGVRLRAAKCPHPHVSGSVRVQPEEVSIDEVSQLGGKLHTCTQTTAQSPSVGCWTQLQAGRRARTCHHCPAASLRLGMTTPSSRGKHHANCTRTTISPREVL